MLDVKTFDLPKFKDIKIDLSQELNDMAAICKKDIFEGLRDGTDIDGNAFKELADATIAAKRKNAMLAQEDYLFLKGRAKTKTDTKKVKSARRMARTLAANVTRPLRDTDNLLRNQTIEKATKTNQTSRIGIGPTREEIGSFHNEGGDNLPRRYFFGISEDVSKKADQLIEMKIDRILRKL